MNDFSEGICPLGSRVYETIQVIQAYHEGWSTEDGACEPCWRSFREAGRILHVLRQTKPKRPGYEWQQPDAPGKEEDAAAEGWPIST